MSLRILGIAGSLRRESFNRWLLREAIALAPAGLEFETADINGIPLFDADLEKRGLPEAVEVLRKQIAAADGLLLVTPEYNRSIPGVFKNVIDWVSRPPSHPFAGKPTAILGASPGPFGTVRAQLHLREICSALGMLVLARPELTVSRAEEKFDPQGALTDEATRESLRKLLHAHLEWILRLQRGAAAAHTGN